MSYETVRDELLVLLTTATLAGGVDIRDDDWRGRNTGQAAVSLVVRRGGPAEAAYHSGGHRSTMWQVVVEIWRRYRGYPETARAIHADLAAVRDVIDKNRRLGGAVVDAFVRQMPQPLEIALPGETSPAWLQQDLVLEIIEEDEVTLAE